jgi:hypothetical protein
MKSKFLNDVLKTSAKNVPRIRRLGVVGFIHFDQNQKPAVLRLRQFFSAA